MTIASIYWSNMGSYRIFFKDKAKTFVTIASSLKIAIKTFFKQTKDRGLSETNTAFMFVFEED